MKTTPTAGPRRRRSIRTIGAVLLTALMLLLAACDTSPPTTESTITTGAPSTTTTEAASTPGLPGRPGGGDADENPPAFFDGRLVEADYWDEELKILSANMGFDGIIGWPDTEFETIRAGGGSFYAEGCAVDNPLVSGATATGVEALYRGVADDTPDYDDGLPIVFTWPILTSTINPEDFLFTLNTGEQVVPNSAGIMPNWELNERNVPVVFGDFGNRLDGPDAVYVEKLEIVDDGTPLMFLGPNGVQSGVGLTWEDGRSPYESGPVLVGAKLNHVGDRPAGEGGAPPLERVLLPNDEFALYGGGDFRLRLLTSGGYTPTGIDSLTPNAYENHFRIHAAAEDGSTVLLSEVGVDYEVAGGTLRVLGLADLGQAEDQGATYDLCYQEDADNYIDIILIGDEAAARSITHVEVPSEGEYLPLYNPGGPGPTPFPDVRYTAPSPPDLEPVLIALDDPMRVSTP
ncbi:MAG: phospholipase [Acidimicrobiia bacterium]|nr:MAG: phospholipase [Acidimicrobiia bacterium]